MTEVLPYGSEPNSGFAGSDTSEERARRDDANGTTRMRQSRVIALLSEVGEQGVTWKEVAERFGWHHGQASGALSALHKANLISRLSETRLRCKVYVLGPHVNGREVEGHGSTSATLLLAEMAVLLGCYVRDCGHAPIAEDWCVDCRTRGALRKHDQRGGKDG